MLIIYYSLLVKLVLDMISHLYCVGSRVREPTQYECDVA